MGPPFLLRRGALPCCTRQSARIMGDSAIGLEGQTTADPEHLAEYVAAYREAIEANRGGTSSGSPAWLTLSAAVVNADSGRTSAESKTIDNAT